MSPRQSSESGAAALQEPPSPVNPGYRALYVGDPGRPRLIAADMMRIFDVKSARFYELQAAGKFDRFESRPAIGRRTWSRKLVAAYLDGEGSSSRFVKRSA